MVQKYPEVCGFSVYYIIHKRLSVESVLKHINLVQSLVYLASLHKSSSKWFCYQNFVKNSRTLPFALHYFLLDMITNVIRIRRMEIIKHHFMQHFQPLAVLLSQFQIISPHSTSVISNISSSHQMTVKW
jgi:hypothetical protein